MKTIHTGIMNDIIEIDLYDIQDIDIEYDDNKLIFNVKDNAVPFIINITVNDELKDKLKTLLTNVNKKIKNE